MDKKSLVKVEHDKLKMELEKMRSLSEATEKIQKIKKAHYEKSLLENNALKKMVASRDEEIGALKIEHVKTEMLQIDFNRSKSLFRSKLALKNELVERLNRSNERRVDEFRQVTRIRRSKSLFKNFKKEEKLFIWYFFSLLAFFWP